MTTESDPARELAAAADLIDRYFPADADGWHTENGDGDPLPGRVVTADGSPVALCADPADAGYIAALGPAGRDIANLLRSRAALYATYPLASARHLAAVQPPDLTLIIARRLLGWQAGP
jgi:hypothetical protein